MPSGRYATEVQPRVNFTMDPELFRRVVAYHKAIDPNRLASETMRELLWTAVNGADPTSGVLIAARKLGFHHSKSYALSRISTFLIELGREMAGLSHAADANAFNEAQLAVTEAERARNK